MSQNPKRPPMVLEARPIPPAAVFRDGWTVQRPEAAEALAVAYAAGLMRRGHSRAAAERAAGLTL